MDFLRNAQTFSNHSSEMQLSMDVLEFITKDGKVAVPSFDSTELEAGIVHLGVGNFHRSHLATYMNDLFQDKELFEANKQWGLVGAGVLHFDTDKS